MILDFKFWYTLFFTLVLNMPKLGIVALDTNYKLFVTAMPLLTKGQTATD